MSNKNQAAATDNSYGLEISGKKQECYFGVLLHPTHFRSYQARTRGQAGGSLPVRRVHSFAGN